MTGTCLDTEVEAIMALSDSSLLVKENREST